ncbi:hypothetical protein FWH58_00850 [Candidatus Saccharibacteria bacterium]|nr:hypothetical protein [Candidatus Saccharibacteria bacterium]
MAGDNLARKLEPGENTANGPGLRVIQGGLSKQNDKPKADIVPFQPNQALANAEKQVLDQAADKNPRDIGKQERDHGTNWMTNTAAKFDNLEAKRQAAIAASQDKSNNFFTRHKKGVIGGLIGLIIGGGMFGLAGILAGPAQLLQIYHFFDDTYNAVHKLVTVYREGRISSSLAKGIVDSNQQRVIDSRLGKVGQKVASGYESQMASKGVYLGVDSAGRPTMSIDPGAHVLSNSQYNLRDPNEAGISSRERYQRQQAIERANNNLQAAASELDIPIKPIDPNNPTVKNGKVVVDVETPAQIGALGKRNANKFFRRWYEAAGMGKASGEIGMRAYATKAGFVDALFHPIQAATTQVSNYAYDKVTSLFTRMKATPEQARANSLARSNQDLEIERQQTTDSRARAEIDEQTHRNNVELERLKTQGVEPGHIGTRRGYLGQIEGARATAIEGHLEKIGRAAGIIMFVVLIVCQLHNLAESGAADAFVHTVIPAIKLAGIMTNTPSQMMAGDLSLDDVGAITKAFIYDDQYPVVVSETTARLKDNYSYDYVDSSGDSATSDLWSDYEVDPDPGTISINETVTSSFWNACTVQTELDPTYQCSDTQQAAINGQLIDVAKGTAATTVRDRIVDGMNSMMPGSGTLLVRDLLNGLCSERGMFVVTIASVAVAGIMGFFTGDWTGFGLALAGAVVNYLPSLNQAAKQGVNFALDLVGATSWQERLIALVMNAIGPAMEMIAPQLDGEDIDWITVPPEVKGNIAAYGASYNAQLIGVSDGGVALNSSQAMAWKAETNLYLAEQFAAKPLLAQLFDPTDYRSMVATLGRNADINPNGGLRTQLANTAKMFAVLPGLAFSSFLKGPANAVMAASGMPAYDYNVPTVTVPLDVLDNMGDQADPSTDIFGNAEKVAEILNGSNGKKYDDLAKICLGKAINHNDLTVTNVDPTNDGYGITFYYMMTESSAYQTNNCSSLMDTSSSLYDRDFVRIAIYAGLDWGIVNAQGCYFGDEEACAVVGISTGGGTAAPTGPITGGMSLEQAEKLRYYYENTLTDSELRALSVYLVSSGCVKNGRWNCVALSQYFVNAFTTVSSKFVTTGNGNDVATNLASQYGWTLDTTPEPYAIFSIQSPGNHTGVVLGVNPDGTIIIGEAHCQITTSTNGDFTEVQQKTVAEFESWYGGKMVFVHIPQDQLKLDELAQIVGGAAP